VSAADPLVGAKLLLIPVHAHRCRSLTASPRYMLSTYMHTAGTLRCPSMAAWQFRTVIDHLIQAEPVPSAAERLDQSHLPGSHGACPGRPIRSRYDRSWRR
jgi:hypothetical protein